MPRPVLLFSTEAVLVVPDRVTGCEGVLVTGNRDTDGHPQVLCSFVGGMVVRPLPPGIEVSSAIVLSPSDARARWRASSSAPPKTPKNNDGMAMQRAPSVREEVTVISGCGIQLCFAKWPTSLFHFCYTNRCMSVLTYIPQTILLFANLMTVAHPWLRPAS
jgi:hypothetical protein